MLITNFATAEALTDYSTQGKVIFVSNRTGNYQIYLKDLSSGQITNLSNNSYNDMNAQLSADNSQAVFYSDRAGNNQIYKFNLASPYVVTRLTNNNANEYDPTFMPDGRILYKSDKSDRLGDIWLMNGDGSNQRNLTPSLKRTEEWKPDALGTNKVIFTSRLKRGQPSSDELYSLDLITNNVTRLTNNKVPDWYPEVSPDGSKVAFISKKRQDDPDAIYIMSPDGSNQQPITNSSKIIGDSDDPSWSPDGQSMAFVNYSQGSYDIYVMEASGNNIKPIEVHSGNELSPFFLTQ